MGVDANGMLWLSDLWSAAVFSAAVLGVFLVIHHHVSNARPAAERTMAIRARRPRRASRHATRGAARRAFEAGLVSRPVPARWIPESVAHEPHEPSRTAAHESRTRRIAA